MSRNNQKLDNQYRTYISEKIGRMADNLIERKLLIQPRILIGDEDSIELTDYQRGMRDGLDIAIDYLLEFT